ncbi:MAG: hypothetical protein QOG49_542 [Frankiaceae bacterium]|nr:hypothetical protein [Frankiaceae bacterium]
MEIERHIEALRAEGERLARAAGAAGLDAPVPTCPEWEVRDLIRHIGGVHRWATVFVAGGRTTPTSAAEDEVIWGPQPSDESLLEWFAEGHRALVAALSAAPDALDCMTFLPAPSPRAFWARRQAHETAIHRADAESASGPITAVAADIAVDGIDELLTGFFARSHRGPRIDEDVTLEISATDADATWFVRAGPAGYAAARGGGDADCAIAGAASDLYLLLWNRGTPAPLTVRGAGGVLDLWRAGAIVRWR